MSETNENKRSSHKDFKNLLDQLQMESWQLELIISGVAIFAVWELKSVVGQLRNFSHIYGESSSVISNIIPLLGIGMSAAWIILFINLIVHIFSRGLWIGVIGLRYVSEDIDFDGLNYAPKFDHFLKNKVGAFDDYIEKLERFSSILFAYTFFLIFLLLSFASYIGFFILMVSGINYLDPPEIIQVIAVFTLLIGSAMVFFDFIFLGAIKKVRDKTISTAYFWIYRFISLITLSFLYRPVLYNFLDDKFARKFFLFSIPYFIIILMFSGIIFNPTPYFPFRDITYSHDTKEISSLSFSLRHYDDERKNLKQNMFGSKYSIKYASLPSKVFEKNYGQVFLRMYHKDEVYFENKKGISSYDKNGLLHDIKDTQEKDLVQTQLKEKRDSFLKIHILEKVDVIKKIRKDLLDQPSLGTKILDEKIVLDTIYWKNQKDSIRQVWKSKIQKAKSEKIYNIRDAMLELNEVTIDNIAYNDSLSCKFYIHPNLGERGLLCFFPLKNIEDGEHIMDIERKVYRESRRSGRDTILFNTSHTIIPFYIYKD